MWRDSCRRALDIQPKVPRGVKPGLSSSLARAPSTHSTNEDANPDLTLVVLLVWGLGCRV